MVEKDDDGQTAWNNHHACSYLRHSANEAAAEKKKPHPIIPPDVCVRATMGREKRKQNCNLAPAFCSKVPRG